MFKNTISILFISILVLCSCSDSNDKYELNGIWFDTFKSNNPNIIIVDSNVIHHVDSANCKAQLILEDSLYTVLLFSTLFYDEMTKSDTSISHDRFIIVADTLCFINSNIYYKVNTLFDSIGIDSFETIIIEKYIYNLSPNQLKLIYAPLTDTSNHSIILPSRCGLPWGMSSIVSRWNGTFVRE